MHAHITPRLDYCNSLYLGLPQSLLSRLQLVQNSAERLLTGSRKLDHITPILASLHWLPSSTEFILKPYLNDLAPPYIKELIHHQSTPRSLRSCSIGLPYVPRARNELPP